MQTSNHWFDQWRARLTVACGIFLVLGYVTRNDVLSYLAVGAGSVFALQSAWSSIKAREIDVNFLMVLAAVGSVVLGRPLEAAVLLFLFSLSSTLESLALAKTQSAVEGLMKLRPDSAVLISADGDVEVPLSNLRIGDHIRIHPFAHVPLDATVLEGESSVDQSAMTGESVPVHKRSGDALLGGTQNLDGLIVAQVAAVHGESTLDKIVTLVQSAQENKGSGERISHWFGQRYTIFVVIAFFIALTIRLATGESLHDASYSALTLLVALSPCALVISIPATTLSALAWAARNGMLIRGGQFIEEAGRTNAIVLDKTGTLTRGQHELVEICMCTRPLVRSGGGTDCVDESQCWHGEPQIGSEPRRILEFAACAEAAANHPIANAIVLAARSNGIEVSPPETCHVFPGLGVVAEISGTRVAVGQRELFRELNEELPEDFTHHLDKLRNSGLTVVVVKAGDSIAGLGLRDALRPEAKAAISDFVMLGMDPIAMLTGDTKQTAESVASQLNIKEVYANLMPQRKVDVVREIQQRNKRVLMVGDGINDAPSLTAANLGVAMGGLGSDIALNSADVVLMRDSLGSVSQLIMLGRKANRIIFANLLFATGVIAALTITSLFFTLPLPIAVLGHEGSTVLVILNGLRLLSGPARVS